VGALKVIDKSDLFSGSAEEN
jgi:serine/threonine protein kinase